MFTVCCRCRCQRLKFALVFLSPLLPLGFHREFLNKVWDLWFFPLYFPGIIDDTYWWRGGGEMGEGKWPIIPWLGQCFSEPVPKAVTSTVLLSLSPPTSHPLRRDRKTRGGWSWALPFPPYQLGSGKIFFLEGRPWLRKRENSGCILKWLLLPSLL